MMVALSRISGCRVFRNNVGMGWAGEVVQVSAPTTLTVFPGDVLVRKARPLHAGLFKGSADLIGWTARTVTPEMVGQRVAVFTSIEGKTATGRARDDQIQWGNTVSAAGGIAVIARSEQDAVSAVCSGVAPPFEGAGRPGRAAVSKAANSGS